MNPPRRQARSVARLAAVQALYQMDIAGAGVETVAREFSQYRFAGDLEGEQLAEADEAFFGELIRGVVEQRAALDKAISARLKEGWRLDRLDATVRAILRCATFELNGPPQTPVEIAVDEYVEIARSFFGPGTEIGLVNALLDGLARDGHGG